MSEQRRTGIILGEYKGLQVPGFDRTITDEDVMESLRRLQAQNVYHQEVEGRPVQNGDIATIDYEGFYKGKPFQGGKGSEYPHCDTAPGTLLRYQIPRRAYDRRSALQIRE